MPVSGPEDYIVRKLHPDDYDRGYLDVLTELSVVGSISKADFIKQLSKMPLDLYKQYVVIEKSRNRVVGTGTLLIEHKIIHSCGLAGHIEDVVVAEECRGKSLGRLIIDALIGEAKAAGCYKVVLDCAEKNVSFYERCGFKKKELQMALYLQ